jgi:hypothetical protein
MSSSYRSLAWPAHLNRTPREHRTESRYGAHSWAQAKEKLVSELGRWNAYNITICCDYVNPKGTLTGRPRRDDDPGVAVYFRVGQCDYSLACDGYFRPEDNLWDIHLYLTEKRALTRRKTSQSLEQELAGFKALPPPAKAWHEVLGIYPDASLDEAEAIFRAKAKKAHPDAGGSESQMLELNQAIEEARRQLSNG